MKASLFYAFVILASAISPILGEQSLDSIQKMEASGDTTGARTALARAAQASPNSAAAWTAYAPHGGSSEIGLGCSRSNHAQAPWPEQLPSASRRRAEDCAQPPGS